MNCYLLSSTLYPKRLRIWKICSAVEDAKEGDIIAVDSEKLKLKITRMLAECQKTNVTVEIRNPLCLRYIGQVVRPICNNGYQDPIKHRTGWDVTITKILDAGVCEVEGRTVYYDNGLFPPHTAVGDTILFTEWCDKIVGVKVSKEAQTG